MSRILGHFTAVSAELPSSARDDEISRHGPAECDFDCVVSTMNETEIFE